MPRVLLTLDEVRDALAQLPIITVAEQQCIDGEALLAAVEALVPIRLNRQAAPSRREVVSSRDGMERVTETPADPVPTVPPARGDITVMNAPTIEVAQALLDSLPRGNCVGCSHFDHGGGRCVECDCTEYVDDVVRDPMEYARDAMTNGAEAPTWWPAPGEIQPMTTVGDADISRNPFAAGRAAHDGAPIQ